MLALESHLRVRAVPEASYVVPTGFTRSDRYCFTFEVPDSWVSDINGSSSIRLLEDDRYLGPSAADHESIRRQGGGCFSHWGSTVMFSTSDNSSPVSNGRTYTLAWLNQPAS
jgi:hypothetical protein